MAKKSETCEKKPGGFPPRVCSSPDPETDPNNPVFSVSGRDKAQKGQEAQNDEGDE